VTSAGKIEKSWPARTDARRREIVRFTGKKFSEGIEMIVAFVFFHNLLLECKVSGIITLIHRQYFVTNDLRKKVFSATYYVTRLTKLNSIQHKRPPVNPF
jgi:hypothetical protein